MTPPPARRRHLASSPFKPAEEVVAEEFEIGDHVSHDKHGVGRVIELEGRIALVADFGNLKSRLTTPFARLHKL